METERRKFTRFLGPENVYAALGPSFSKVGRIKEISIGGLAIEYPAHCTTSLPEGSSGDRYSVIMMTGTNFLKRLDTFLLSCELNPLYLSFLLIFFPSMRYER